MKPAQTEPNFYRLIVTDIKDNKNGNLQFIISTSNQPGKITDTATAVTANE
jgi:hypothetical protein